MKGELWLKAAENEKMKKEIIFFPDRGFLFFLRYIKKKHKLVLSCLKLQQFKVSSVRAFAFVFIRCNVEVFSLNFFLIFFSWLGYEMKNTTCCYTHILTYLPWKCDGIRQEDLKKKWNFLSFFVGFYFSFFCYCERG